jgi:hypothetical protein
LNKRKLPLAFHSSLSLASSGSFHGPRRSFLPSSSSTNSRNAMGYSYMHHIQYITISQF